jgi:3-oxoacyl-[acyl-carrier protein] reductase
MDFENRVVLVTGGSGGIGRAICATLAGEGMRIGLHFFRGDEVAKKVAAELRKGGAEVEVFQADLREPEGAQSLVDRVVDALGSLDVLVNNAGITLGGKDLVDISFEEWRQVMDVNLDSAFYMAKAALPHMRRQGCGQIINIASNIVNSLPGGSAAYAVSKAGLVALTKVLSKEEARHGIRVNAVSPGIIHAGMGVGALERRPPEVREQFLSTIPMGRSGDAEEVAAAVAFLVSDAASYITGQHLTVNGGDRTESYQ